jgi:hypothetical protein
MYACDGQKFLIPVKAFYPAESEGEKGVKKPGYLFESEKAVLEVNSLGAVVHMGLRQQRIVVLNFFVTRMIMGLILEPWNGSFNVKKTDVEPNPMKNLQMLASVMYRCVRSALHPNADVNARRIADQIAKFPKVMPTPSAETAGGAEPAPDPRSSLRALVEEVDADPSQVPLLLPDAETDATLPLVAENMHYLIEFVDRFISLSNAFAGRTDLAKKDDAEP